jgi:hypothetical protein
MGKVTFKGFVPPDDPMFTEGYSFFTISSPKKKPSPNKKESQTTKKSEKDSTHDE